MRFDHLADPDPPIPDRATRVAVADRVERIRRRQTTMRQAAAAGVAVVVLASVVLVNTMTQRRRDESTTTGATCCAAVEGTVTDQVGVVARVVVQLIDPDTPPARAPYSVTEHGSATTGVVPAGPGWRVVARTVTDDEGRFRLTGMEPGRYAVRFEDQYDPLAGKVRHQPTFLGGAETLSAARLVEVAGDRPVLANQRLELSPNYRLMGEVREDVKGYPVRNVTVRLFSGGELARETRTDDQGRYDLGGLDPGAYQLAFADEWDRPAGRYQARWDRDGAVLAMPDDHDLQVDAILTLDD